MKEPIYPNGAESYAAAAEVLKELIPYYYGSQVSEQKINPCIMEFERLMSFNYRSKLKPHCEVWEQRIVSFAECIADRFRYEAKTNHNAQENSYTQRANP